MARNSLKNVCRLIDVANEGQPIEQAFLSDLKRSIEMTANANEHIPSRSYKPSSMNCIRNMYYQIIGMQPDKSSSTYCSVGICNSGSDIHLRVQKAVMDMQTNGFDCEYIKVSDFVRQRNLDYLEIVKEPDFENGEYETKLYHKNLNMSFLCDGIIRYKNRYYILEIKTEISSKWYSRNGVDEKHYKQGTAYSIALQLPEVIFLYVSRDVLDMKDYLFVPTDEMKNNLIGEIDECDGYVTRQICPPKPENVHKKTCEYCGYKEQCRRDG